MTEEFKLSQSDLISPTWLRLKKYMDARLESLRIRNESDLDPIATARLRGEQKVYRNLLALSETAPAMAEDESQI